MEKFLCFFFCNICLLPKCSKGITKSKKKNFSMKSFWNFSKQFFPHCESNLKSQGDETSQKKRSGCCSVRFELEISLIVSFLGKVKRLDENKTNFLISFFKSTIYSMIILYLLLCLYQISAADLLSQAPADEVLLHQGSTC